MKAMRRKPRIDSRDAAAILGSVTQASADDQKLQHMQGKKRRRSEPSSEIDCPPPPFLERHHWRRYSPQLQNRRRSFDSAPQRHRHSPRSCHWRKLLDISAGYDRDSRRKRSTSNWRSCRCRRRRQNPGRSRNWLSCQSGRQRGYYRRRGRRKASTWNLSRFKQLTSAA